MDDDDEEEENKESGNENDKKEAKKSADEGKTQPAGAKEGKKSVSQPLKTKETVPGLDMVESQTRYFNAKKEPSPAGAKPEEQKEGERKREESASDEKSEQLPESKKQKHLDSEAKEEASPEKKAEKSNVLMPKFPDSLPRTLQEFVLLWKSYEPSAELRARLLFLLPPEKIPQFFKDSMTPAFLGEIVSVLQAHGTAIDAQKTLGWMENLPSVGRFTMLRFGFTQKDKQSKKKIFECTYYQKPVLIF